METKITIWIVEMTNSILQCSQRNTALISHTCLKVLRKIIVVIIELNLLKVHKNYVSLNVK